MATLQKIRNNAGLLVSLVIGFALLAFILGDLLKAGGSIFGTSKTEVAEIAGKSVPIQLFQQKIDENTENYKRNYQQSNIDQTTMENIQDQTWEELIREYVMTDEYEELGIAVSGDELFDMVQGNNIHPQIMQIPIFKNQQTGQFDRNLVIQFLKNMELDPTGNAQASWTAFEKSISHEQINTKYNSLIQKGLFVNKVQAKFENKAKNSKINFEYVNVPYTSVSDSAITISQTDIEKYYNENLDKFNQEEACEVNYITFPIVASAEDDAQTMKLVADLIPEFETVENVEQFVNLNSDTKFAGKFYAENELPVAIADLYNANEGAVFGPYKEEDAYKAARVIKFENIPDSVKARHILISGEQYGANVAVSIADSLLAVIKAGGNFAEIAQEYSSDKGSAVEGGDLGWFTEGQMVKPFNDACFFGKNGELQVVNSQFGVHIIEVLEQAKASKKVQVGILTRTVEASSQTYQNTYAKASQFGSSNRTYQEFMDAAEKEKLQPRYAKFAKNDRKVANLESPRQLIRWAFKADEGQVSEIFELGETYVIAAVKKHDVKGTAPLENVKVDIEREVKKQKAADYIATKMNDAKANASTLQTIAESFSVPVKEVSNATFASYSVPGLGVEPALQGVISSIELNKISEPVKGNRGVYIIKVNMVTEAQEASIERERNYIATALASRVRYEVYNAIKEASNIEDRRSEFY